MQDKVTGTEQEKEAGQKKFAEISAGQQPYLSPSSYASPLNAAPC